ncbi:MAG: acyltransferase [Acidimicrobiales bacterium]
MDDLNRTKHWPGLDGMRAFAVLAVVGDHLVIVHFDQGGYLGVDVFFVLSGFLITSLLLGEKSSTGRVSMRDFYVRRALRLLPALFAVILLAVIAVLTISNLSYARPDTLGDIPAVLLFVGNWLIVLSGQAGQTGHLGILAQTWSLSVEEQFYLIWPLTLMIAMRRLSVTRVAGWLLFLMGFEWIVRLLLVISGVNYSRTYYSTLLHSDGLLIGAALALLASERRIPAKLANSRRIPFVAIAIIVAMMLVGNGVEGIEWAIMTPITVVATAIVIMAVTSGTATPLTRMLSVKPLLWIGKRSYGIYLWSATILWVLQSTNWYVAHVYDGDAVAVIITFAAAAASYSLIEHPALKLKERRYSRTEALPQALEDGRTYGLTPEL